MISSQASFDSEGFIENPSAWDKELAQHLASGAGLSALNDDHWRVIGLLRHHYFTTGGVPMMRQICHDAGLRMHCVSDLMENPRIAWQIAGLPNPGEEANSYLASAEILSGDT